MKFRIPLAPLTVAAIVTLAVTLLVTFIGVPFAIIVGGSAIVAAFVWLFTTYRYPVDPRRTLPLFVLAVGMQFVHMTEEFIADFPGHFSATTGAHFTSYAFIIIAVLGGGMAYAFAGYGLTRRNPFANYVLWFFLIGPAGLVNSVAHVALPVLAGQPYFPGLITVILPTAFGTALAIRILRDVRHHSRRARSQSVAQPLTSTSSPAPALTLAGV
jgi:hypothetical protein